MEIPYTCQSSSNISIQYFGDHHDLGWIFVSFCIPKYSNQIGTSVCGTQFFLFTPSCEHRPKRLRFNWWQARRLNQNSKKSFFWFHSVLMCFVMSIRVCLNIYGKPMERPRIWWLNMAFFILRSRLDSFPKCGWILPETSSELVILCPKICFLAIWVWKWWSENGVYTSHNNRDNYDWPVDLGFSP